MSKITLKPLDDGQKAVEIPLGKTTIGRGPFLGCSDKKVSRNHAVLEVTDKGEVYLTPTHVNPCFYQPTADSPGQILKKDTPHKLENGDSFSLLPRAFRYQLIVNGDDEDKTSDQNDLNKQLDKTNGTANESSEESLNKTSKDQSQDISTDELIETSMNEKSLNKEEELASNDKNCSKKENNFPKKVNDISNDNKSPSFKENKELIDDKEKAFGTENNCVSKSEEGASGENQAKECSDDIKEDSYTDDTHIEGKGDNEKAESSVKENESSVIDSSVQDDKPKAILSDKVIEENESTLGHDSFPKENKLEKDNAALDIDKTDTKTDQELLENKEIINENETNGEDERETDINKSLNAEINEERTRTLPDWMEELPTPGQGKRKASTPKKPRGEKQPPKRKAATQPKPRGRKKLETYEFDEGQEGNSQRQVPGRTSSRTNRQTRQGLSLEDFIVSDDDEWQSDQSDPKPRRKRGSRKDDSGSDWEVEHKRSKKVTHKFGSGSESASDWENRKKKKGPKGKRRKSKRAAVNEPATDDEVDLVASDVPKSDKKAACKYGKKCYSHPGDSDYTSEPEAAEKNEGDSDDESDVNKKECPYGANCFRKNPQHKKDFKHTKKVRPQREAAKQADKKTKSSRNSDEVDSYDLNDSLLNEDSDEYKPIDSGSDYESGEKMKRFSKGKTPKSKRGKRV